MDKVIPWVYDLVRCKLRSKLPIEVWEQLHDALQSISRSNTTYGHEASKVYSLLISQEAC